MDPMLTLEYIHAVREAYAPGLDPGSSRLSPLFGDFACFPPRSFRWAAMRSCIPILSVSARA